MPNFFTTQFLFYFFTKSNTSLFFLISYNKLGSKNQGGIFLVVKFISERIHYLKNNKGFSLVEISLVAALMIVVGYGLSMLMGNLFKSSKAVNQNSERQQLLDEARHLLQTQAVCTNNFRGLDPTKENNLTNLKFVDSGGNLKNFLSTDSTITYGTNSIRITQITFGGGSSYTTLPSPDSLNGIATLTIRVERIGPQGQQYGGDSKPFNVPIAVRRVPTGTPGPPNPGTVDYCRLGSGGISVTNLFNIDDGFPATAPPVGVNLKTAYSPDYNIALGNVKDELYNIRFRTEGGDMLAKDGNLYITRDAPACQRRRCSHANTSGDPLCTTDSACNTLMPGSRCIQSWASCPSSIPPNTGNNLLQGADGDIVIGFGEYSRMVNTFGTNPGGLGFPGDQMYMIGWDSGSSNIGVVMPADTIFKFFGVQSPTTFTRASLAASGNIYTNYGDVVGLQPSYGTEKAKTSFIGFGNWETIIQDAHRYGVDPAKVYAIGWADGSCVGCNNTSRAGVMMPEGMAWNWHFQDADASGSVKPGFFRLDGNTLIQGNLRLRATQGTTPWQCSGAQDYSGIGGALVNSSAGNHCGTGRLELDGNLKVNGIIEAPPSGEITLTGNLTVNGQIQSTGNLITTNISSNGNITATGTISAASDVTLKKHIHPLNEPHESDPEFFVKKLLEIQGVSFYWKDSALGKEKQIGVIAQNVEKVFPELVKTDKKGRKSVLYQNFVAPIIEALRVIYNKLTGLSETVNQLEKEIQILKKENQDLREVLCTKHRSLNPEDPPPYSFCQP